MTGMAVSGTAKYYVTCRHICKAVLINSSLCYIFKCRILHLNLQILSLFSCFSRNHYSLVRTHIQNQTRQIFRMGNQAGQTLKGLSAPQWDCLKSPSWLKRWFFVLEPLLTFSNNDFPVAKRLYWYTKSRLVHILVQWEWVQQARFARQTGVGELCHWRVNNVWTASRPNQ